ncbi:MAG: prolyl oligopeptidase family serine peptidase [Pseudomonadota bacterium]
MRSHVAVGCALALCATAGLGDAWPYPDDTPSPGSVSLGLAGSVPADVTRYLMAHGASDVRVSPDGRHAGFLWSISGSPQLWRVALDGGAPEQLTFGDAIRDFHWAPNSKAFLIARDIDGNEREGYTLLDIDGRKERIVLPPSNAFRWFGGFSADGQRIIYSSTERNGTDYDIYVTAIASRESRRILEGSFGYFPAALHPDEATLLLSETRGEDANNLHSLDIATGNLTPLFRPTVAAAFEQSVWRRNGSGFYVISDVDREHKSILFVDEKTAKPETIVAARWSIDELALCDNDRVLLYVVNENGYSRLGAYDVTVGKALAVPDLPAGVYDIDCARQAPAAVVRVVGPSVSGDIYAWDFSASDARHVFAGSLAGLDPNLHFVEPEVRTFAARDGVQLQGLLYLPRGAAPPDGFPLLVEVHGGPTGQRQPSFRPVEQYLVNTGVAVFAVNVRGSTGFGKTYTRLDNQERRLDSVRDLVDTVAFLSNDPRIDTARAAVMGGSYGGYMVNAVLGTYPGVFRAGVSFVGVSDWVRALNEASPALKASDRLEYGDIREARWQTFYAKNSPINTVDAINVPMLFSHGVNDPRDPVTESDRMVRRLRENGLDVVYLRFADEGHSVRKVRNKVALYQAVAGFLDKALQLDRSDE